MYGYPLGCAEEAKVLLSVLAGESVEARKATRARWVVVGYILGETDSIADPTAFFSSNDVGLRDEDAKVVLRYLAAEIDGHALLAALGEEARVCFTKLRGWLSGYRLSDPKPAAERLGPAPMPKVVKNKGE